MQKSLVRKGIALVIIVLFVGASVLPSISGDIGKRKFESHMDSFKYIEDRRNSKMDPPEEEWNVTFGDTGDEIGEWVELTSDGGYIIAGRGGEGAWLIKTDANGTKEWDNTWGGGRVECVQQTSDGGYILGGTNNSNFWLIKTDASGNEQWKREYDKGNSENMEQVIQTDDGGYAMVGNTFWPNTGDIYFVKTYANGTMKWDKIFGGTGFDIGYSVDQTSDGELIITGSTTGSYSESEDAFLIKTYSSNGSMVWQKHFGGAYNNDFGHSVIQVSDGYIIGGGTKSFEDVSGDAWLIKTDLSGNELWNETYGDADEGWCDTVEQTYDGGYILSGSCDHIPYESGNVWLIKTDEYGNESWDKIFGGTGQDLGKVVRQTSDGGYIVVAETESYGNGSKDIWLIKVAPDGGGNQPPEITDVTLTTSDPLDTDSPFGWENFSCTVTDSDGVDEVKLVLIGDVTTEYTMTNVGGDNYYKDITISTADEYMWHIWANDTSGNENTSTPQPFDLPLNADVNVDGKVHFMDLVAVSSKYNNVGPPGWIREDVDNNGKVHFMDLIGVSGQYGQTWKP